MFSSRASADLTPNRYSVVLEDLRARGVRLIDLTLSNPTEAGFEYPASLLAPLADAAARRYQPTPLGLSGARDAVAAEYARRGVGVPQDRIVLTASTSEAYALLFKLLCDPGDEILAPVPSYPLVEHLTRLEGVQTVAYPLEYHGRWRIDRVALARAAGDRSRAVLVVSPNNPTGSFLTAQELEWLAAFCAERDLALIGDEVFADYPFGPAGPSVASQDACLAFALGGLSKSAGLPQVKLGWIALAGPASLVHQTTARLELILDTYLSVSTPVQHAAADLLAAGAAIRDQIRRRTSANLATACDMVGGTRSLELLDVEGGWSAVLRVPATTGEERLALELLQEDGVIVHPGYFFDFPHEAFLVVSLLTRPEDFRRGLQRVIERAI
jgi:alanine-synthesizing transaminase